MHRHSTNRDKDRHMLNHGAKTAKDYQYCTEEVIECTTFPTEAGWDCMMRQVRDAERWARERGNGGDGFHIQNVADLRIAIADRDPDAVAKAAVKVLSGRMHPTARDIVGGAARQCIYTLTGRRAYTFEQ